jgi:hypothetical protein
MSELRTTLELQVEERLFAKTVQRWRERVQMFNLPKARWDRDFVTAAMRVYGELCRLGEGHTHSNDYAGGVPTLADHERLCREVDDLIQRCAELRRT